MNLRSFRCVGLALALVGPCLVSGTAHATASDTALLLGNGSYSPGLPLTGCVSHGRMDYTATLVVEGDEPGVYTVSFTGNGSGCDTLIEESGVGNLAGDLSGTAYYHRTGTTSSWMGTVSLRGNMHTIATATCQHLNTSYNPVTSFTVVCSWLLED